MNKVTHLQIMYIKTWKPCCCCCCRRRRRCRCCCCCYYC